MPYTSEPVFRSLRLEPVVNSVQPRHYYELVMPVRADGHIDMRGWDSRPTACRIFREGPERDVIVGSLEPIAVDRWSARYPGREMEQISIRLGERVAPGELVTIESEGGEHLFRIASQAPAR